MARASAARRGFFTRVREAAGRAMLRGFISVMRPVPETQAKDVLKESLSGTMFGDYGSADPELNGFRRLTDPKGQYRRELNPLAYEQMLKIAHFLYASNPMARFLIDKRVSLVVGKEIGYSVEVNAQQAGMSPDQAKELVARIRSVLDRFWEHPTHDIRHRASEYATTYLVSGSLTLPVQAINDVNGVPQLDMVDAAQIEGITAVEGSSMVAGLVRIKSSGGVDVKKLPIIRANAEGVLVGAEHYGGVEGLDRECFYFRRGRLLNSLTGISDLMDIADWLDGHDQYLFASLERSILKNNLVWDLLVDNGNQKLVDEELAKVRAALSAPGSTYAHNEKTTLEAKTAHFEGGDMAEVARLFRTHILGAKGIPESWYAEGGNANRATAGEQTDVTYKELVALQEEFRRIFRTMLHYAYDKAQAKQGGVAGSNLPKRSEPWLTLEPMLPPIAERDISRASTSLTQVVSAIGVSVDEKFLSRQTARKVVLMLVDKLGVQVDGDEEAAQIESEAEGNDEATAERVRKGLEDALDKNLGPDTPAVADPARPALRLVKPAATGEPGELAPEQVNTGLAVQLNGAQIQAAVGIVKSVAAGEIPRDSGVSQLELLFGLSHADADRLMGSAGTKVPTTPNPIGGTGGKAAAPPPPLPPKAAEESTA